MTPNRITSNVYLTLQSHDAALHCITSNIALYRYSFKAFTLHSWHIYIYKLYIHMPCLHAKPKCPCSNADVEHLLHGPPFTND